MRPVHVLAVGTFGQAVAAQLGATLDTVISHPLSPPGQLPLPAGLADPGRPPAVVVVAAGRPVPAVTERVDELSFRRRVRWLPVLIESGALRIGPMVVPGAGACYRCFRLRLRQHAAAPTVEAALEQHYRASVADEPRGHLPGAVTLAAGTAADVIERTLDDPGAEAGRVRQRDLATGRLTAGRAVGVHGCDRCGLHRDEQTRSSAELRRAMSEALQWTE